VARIATVGPVGRNYAEAVARLNAADPPVIENFCGMLPVELQETARRYREAN
jgi:hypothetical protein